MTIATSQAQERFWRARRLPAVEEVRPGDVVWFPPAEKQWHGATRANALTHIAIQERLDGKTVDWLEQVSEEQYSAPHPESGRSNDRV